MAKMKVPSLQHLARNWRDDANRVCRLLVNVALNPPIFNYNALFFAVRDLLVLGVPYDQVEAGVWRIKRADVRENLLGILPLIRDHFAGVAPDFFQSVDRRYYPVARELMVPFDPPMIFGVGGQIYFPWFSFWRSNPLASERLSLFATLVDEVLMQDPDLEDARFEILDFSIPKGGNERVLSVVDAREIPRVSESQKREMLTTFAEGFRLAQIELAGRPAEAEGDEKTQQPDPRQGNLFDDAGN